MKNEKPSSLCLIDRSKRLSTVALIDDMAVGAILYTGTEYIYTYP